MKRHRFDPFSFLFGAVFVTIGATFLFASPGAGHVQPAHVWPAVIVVVGLSLVVWAVTRALRPEPLPVNALPSSPEVTATIDAIDEAEDPPRDEGADADPLD